MVSLNRKDDLQKAEVLNNFMRAFTDLVGDINGFLVRAHTADLTNDLLTPEEIKEQAKTWFSSPIKLGDGTETKCYVVDENGIVLNASQRGANEHIAVSNLTLEDLNKDPQKYTTCLKGEITQSNKEPYNAVLVFYPKIEDKKKDPENKESKPEPEDPSVTQSKQKLIRHILQMLFPSGTSQESRSGEGNTTIIDINDDILAAVCKKISHKKGNSLLDTLTMKDIFECKPENIKMIKDITNELKDTSKTLRKASRHVAAAKSLGSMLKSGKVKDYALYTSQALSTAIVWGGGVVELMPNIAIYASKITQSLSAVFTIAINEVEKNAEKSNEKNLTRPIVAALDNAIKGGFRNYLKEKYGQIQIRLGSQNKGTDEASRGTTSINYAEARVVGSLKLFVPEDMKQAMISAQRA